MKKFSKKLSCLIILVLIALNIFACSSGKTIEPLYTKIDMKNLPDGIYNVKFGEKDITRKDGKVMINCTIYSEDIYDTVDIHQMKVGDTFVQHGKKVKINKLFWDDTQSKCCINFDSWDDAVETINPSDSGGTYYISGPDDHHSYTERGKSNIKLADGCILIDSRDLEMTKTAKGADSVEIYIKENNPDEFWHLNTSVRVENGEIVEITRWYIP